MKRLLILALLISANAAFAESAAEKQALVTKVLKLQQPGVDALARNLVEQPAAQLSQQAAAALQGRVAADQREAVAKKIQSELKKYLDEAGPIVRDRATKLAPATIGTVLSENFTQKELKELVTIMESPVNRKFQQLGGAMQRSLGEKLVEETRPLIEPKAKALEESIARHLGISTAAATPATPAAEAPAKK